MGTAIAIALLILQSLLAAVMLFILHKIDTKCTPPKNQNGKIVSLACEIARKDEEIASLTKRVHELEKKES